ncbi:MAG: hypothetical protein Q8N01_04585 [Sulfuricurvum sp.]|nr:hypothetical protein [Sulfuricurvum sp.]MDP3119672.1 hypothetical protein [Sulfuricurvum sp.]
MSKFILWCLIILSAQAIEPFEEQKPLGMTTPNTTTEKTVKWIPLNSQEMPQKTTKVSTKAIDDSIKNQIQKKMQALLKPVKDDEEDQ